MSEYTSPEPPIGVSARELTPTFASISAAQTDFEASRRDFAIDSALEVAPITADIVEPMQQEFDAGEFDEAATTSERELHRIRKVAEVYEDALRIRLPTGALYRAIRIAGKMSSIGGIFIALAGLNDASSSIEATVAKNGRNAVETSQADDFYFASGVFIGELVLLASPFPARLAFRTTGRLHSRLLWQRFRHHRAEYRLLLHHIYYFAKGIPSLVLHSLQDGIDTVGEFVESIVFLIKTSWEAFEEPAVVADLKSKSPSDFSGSFLSNLSIDAALDRFGDIKDRLEQYIRRVLHDVQTAYENLYDEYLGVNGVEDVIHLVVERLFETYVTG